MELHQNRPHAWKQVQFENACPKSGVSPPPTNCGPKNNLFGRHRNLTTTLTAYIFGMKLDIDNWSSALTTTRVSYIVSKCHEFWSTDCL